MNIDNEIRRNPVLSEVLDVLLVQTKKGLDKYGTTVQYQNLSVRDWIGHAKQETADKLVYLTCIEKSIQLLESKAKAFDMIWGILEDYHNAGTLSENLVIDLVGEEISKVFASLREGEENG